MSWGAAGQPCSAARRATPVRRSLSGRHPAAVAVPLVLLALGCVRLRRPEEPTGPSFTILTYNVNWGGPGPEQALAAIESLDADIVCLQETTSAWEQFLRPRLAPRYAHIRFRHTPQPGGGLAILSRWPFRDAGYVKARDGWFPAWIVHAQTPAGQVQLMNVHLRPPLDARYGSAVRSYFTTREVRLREVQELHAHLEQGMPTLVLGDCNEHDTSRALAWLGKQGLRDALRDFDRHTNTWRWPYGPITVRRRLDHILYSPQLYCCSARVVKAGASDHFPVVAVFQRAPDPPTTTEAAP